MTMVENTATESKLDSQRIGPLQLRVLILCLLIQACDGYDMNAIGYALPALLRAWHLSPAQFSVALLMSNLGILAGALIAGPVGDRFGRKPLLMGSVAIFGVASLLSATASSLAALSVLRFFTGVGIAGGFAGSAALTGDYAPKERRATLIMISFTGTAIGAFLGGQIAALLFSKGFDWSSIFVVGGLAPLILLFAMALWLPEAPQHLAVRKKLTARQAALLQSLGIQPAMNRAGSIEKSGSNPIKELFSGGYALQTVLLWIIFFCGLLNLFLFVFWFPAILNFSGMTQSEAVFAASLHPLGGILPVLYLGWAIDRFGTQRALSLHFAICIVFIAMLGLFSLPYAAILALCFLTGVTINGTPIGSNAACGLLYPARMRTTGVAWALGVGRFGALAAAPLGGYLLSWGLAPRQVLLSAVLFAAIAAVAAASLGVVSKRIVPSKAAESVSA